MKIRPAAVSGSFYPDRPAVLSAQLADFLSQASWPNQVQHLKALVVPHAGYVYSGLTAAHAYVGLHPGMFSRVLLLGPVHRVPVRGLALPDCDAFATPLGEVLLDQQAMAHVSRLPQVSVNGLAHAMEHSLEVQLPFLQRQLGHFTLVPLVVGDASAFEVAEVLELFSGDPDTLIVISTDLSHFLDYEQACDVDAQSIRHVLALESDLSHQQACGATPLNGLLAFMRRHDMQMQLLDLRNSGDTAGDRQRVVGYAALACFERSVV